MSSTPTGTRSHSESPQSQSTLSDLAGRLRRAESTTAEATDVIERSWKQLVSILVVVLLCVWLGYKVRDSRVAALGEASYRFSAAQEAFAKLALEQEKPASSKESDVAAVEEARKNQLRAFEDALHSLRTSDGNVGEYGDLAVLYDAAIKIQEGKGDVAKEALKQFQLGTFSGVTKPAVAKAVTGKELVTELAELLAVKAELQATKELSEGLRTRLKEIALGAQVVGGEALISLARLSNTETARREVAETAKQIFAVRPGVEKVNAQALKDLGIPLAVEPSGAVVPQNVQLQNVDTN